MRQTWRREALVVAALFVAVNVATAWLQAPLRHADGFGWDGVEYARVARRLAAGEPAAAEAPFVFRLGTPALVAVLAPRPITPAGLRGTFLAVNLVANALAVALLVLWLRRFVADTRIRVALVLWFLLAWHAPVRFTWFAPAYVDPWFYVALLAGLLTHARLADEHRAGLLRGATLAACSAIAFGGVLFREVALVVPVSMLVHLRTRRDARLAVPVAAGLAGLALAHALAHPTNAWDGVATAWHWLVTKSPRTVLASLAFAFGPALVLPLAAARTTRDTLARHPELAAALLTFGALGWVGGSDTERLLFWASPLVFPLVGRAAEALGPALRGAPVAVLGVLQLVAMRVFRTVPEGGPGSTSPLPLFTDLAADAGYGDLWALHARARLVDVLLVEHAVVAALLLFWLHRRASASERTEAPLGPAEEPVVG